MTVSRSFGFIIVRFVVVALAFVGALVVADGVLATDPPVAPMSDYCLTDSELGCAPVADVPAVVVPIDAEAAPDALLECLYASGARGSASDGTETLYAPLTTVVACA